MSAGTYMLRIKPFFYIGSSGNLRRRKHDHIRSLTKGDHYNPRLQNAYAPDKNVEFIPLEFIHRTEGDSLDDYTLRLRIAEQMLLDRYRGDPFLCNMNVFASSVDFCKSRWADPEYRNQMLALMREIRGPATEESRRRMSLAKKGSKNIKSRKVIVTDPDEMEMEFDSLTEVAAFFGVTQQLMSLWMTGGVKWPSPNKGRKVNRWVAGYRAVFAQTNPRLPTDYTRLVADGIIERNSRAGGAA